MKLYLTNNFAFSAQGVPKKCKEKVTVTSKQRRNPQKK